MDHDPDHPFPWFDSNDPVPGVDPADLRSMWVMQRPAANASCQSTATDIRLFEHVCSRGANVQAVLYRVWMLWMLVGPMQMLTPWLRDGELADAVFNVAAAFPMERMSVGIVRNSLPFDVQAFLAEIERENNQ